MPRVVIPWRAGCPHRQRALEWCLGRYSWPVTVAEGPPGPWRKALAAMPAIAACEEEIVIVADADVWSDGLQQAVDQVNAGAPWAIPHQRVHRLSEAATTAVIAGAAWDDQDLAQPPYLGLPGGGYVVARREALLEVPLDPRFAGWGQEDTSWSLALGCLLGPPWRGDRPLLHLWHPPEPRLTRARGSQNGWSLHCRYRNARRDPDAMRALIEEAHAFAADKPKLHDHPAAV